MASTAKSNNCCDDDDDDDNDKDNDDGVQEPLEDPGSFCHGRNDVSRSPRREGGTQLRTHKVFSHDRKEFQHEPDKGVDRGLPRKVDTPSREHVGCLKSEKQPWLGLRARYL